MSVLSFGTMTVGGRDRFSKMGNLQVADTERVLDICMEAGVTTVDTADVYSFGGAEEVLGQALKGRRDRLVLVSKVFQRMSPAPHDTGLSRKHIIEACDASLRRLQTDYLDLYISHEPDVLVPIEETMRAFDDLVKAGKVRYVGCSNHAAWQVMKALAVSDREHITRYICQQVNYSLLARDVEHDIIPLALDQGCGLMAWSPLQAGLLTGKFRRDRKPESSRTLDLGVPGTIDYERLYRIVDVMVAIADARGVSVSQVGLNWLINKPGVDTVVIGARDEAQLRDNLAVATWSLTAEEMKRLDDVSELPEPYPQWHQHKFGLERNPRIPARRLRD